MSEEKSNEATEAILMSKVERLRLKTFTTIAEALLTHREEIEALGAETCNRCIVNERNGMLDAATNLFIGQQPGAVDRIVEAIGKSLASPELMQILQQVMESFGKRADPVVVETPGFADHPPTDKLLDEALVSLYRQYEESPTLRGTAAHKALEAEMIKRGFAI